MLSLIIDLSKGRPKGSTNKTHKWIARYTNARGEIVRVYPDRDHGELLENEQFKLKPGVTINQVLHDKLIGGVVEGQTQKVPGAGKRKTDVAPKVRDGEFVRYEVVSESEYRKAAKEAEKKGYENPYKHDAISTKKIGTYYVFGYPKVNAVEHDGDKPTRFGGYVSIEYHPSVKAAGYRTPQKIAAFEMQPHEVKAHAEGTPARSFNEKELPKHGDRGAPRVATVHPLHGDTSTIAVPHLKAAHNLSTESLARQYLLDVEVTDDSDPLDLARQIYDKTALKEKREAAKPGTVSRANFAPWQLAKYESQQELFDKLQKQQVAALISLGVVKPSKSTRKLNAALVKEWTPIIMGLSGDNFDAFKNTPDYRAAVKRDEKRTARGRKTKDVRRYKETVVSDLFQVGMEKLLRVAHAYEVEPENAKHRFDKLAYAAINNEIRKQSRLTAEERGAVDPIKHEGEIEEAMRSNARGGGSMEPLSPHEAAELKKLTPLARHALYEAVTKLPDALRRVVAARLWLDEPDNAGEVPLLDASQSRAETQTRKQRHEKFDDKIAEAEARGEVVERQRRKPRDWEREWTGFGSIADKYQDWIDPETGSKFNIDQYSESHQREVLQNYYRQGIAQIIRQLSVPVTRHRPKKGEKPVVHPESFQPTAEWKQHENHVIVPMSKKELQRLPAEAQLAYTAVGGEPRVLTQAGKAVKRYLQIETKLATQNRRRWMAPGHAREVDASITFKPSNENPTPKPSVTYKIERESPLENQAVRWFASSTNQELAARLGMHDLATHAAVPQQRGVSAGKYADNLFRRARKHYKTYNEVNNLTDAQLKHERSRTHVAHTKLLAKLRKPLEDDAHRATLAGVSQLEAKLHIIDFVSAARSTKKSIVVDEHDTVTSLVKAFFDYDFELDRLWVEFA